MAQTFYDLTNFPNGYGPNTVTPVLSGGDEADADVVTAKSSTEALFTYTYYFDLSTSVGPVDQVSTSINGLQFQTSVPSVKNLSVSFYDLTTGSSAGTIVGGTGTIDLAAGQNYSVTITGNNNSRTKGGEFDFGLQTSVAPVPGPTGFLVAIGGMGALLLKRRRSARTLAA
jgi:hypothetical protein